MILAIAGYAGSGKDTVAKMIRSLVPKTKMVAFADPLKRICQEVFDFTEEQLWGPSKERNKPDRRYLRGYTCDCGEFYGEDTDEASCRACGANLQSSLSPEWLTPRYALQQLGTEWARDCYPSVWADLTLQQADRLLSGETRLVVITDCRFINEAQAVSSHEKGRVLRLVRPQSDKTAIAMDHRSEKEQKLIPGDYTLVNDSTLDDLQSKVQTFVEDEIRGALT